MSIPLPKLIIFMLYSTPKPKLMKFAKVLFQQKTGKDTGTLTYHIPEGMTIEPGQAVKVPIRNRLVSGIVWEISNTSPEFKTLPIKEVNYQKPILSAETMELMKWMEKKYFCSPDKLLKLFVPKGVLENKKQRKSKEKDEQIFRTPSLKTTPSQSSTIKEIKETEANKFLIHGVTGSGKTEIYKNLADEQISNNKQVLILVPEISLTPQIIEYFERGLGIKAAVIHSKISDGKRRKTWEAIWKNEAKLIIGSRSAIFAPFQALSLIIVDEEHEHSYKQEQAPRYTIHAIIDKILEIKKSSAKKTNLKIVFGSATPSVETAEKLKETTIRINERIGTSEMPDMEIVDMRDEFKKKNMSIFSDKLREELNKVLREKKQAILFLNRRGSASSVVCRDCGHTEKCPDCEIPSTYHTGTLNRETLICHHCGKISNPPSTCPVCKGYNIRFLGIGTQKIETEVLKEFPSAKVLRADKDSTTGKYDFEKIYRSFRNHEADILIGTQMIAKGLHLPKVTLVGVIMADIGLNIPDFRAAERNFQLMTQVSGRAGRCEEKGKVVIQTYNPDHIALLCAKEQNYDKFFNYERTQRKILNNPPFGQIAKITIEERSFDKCKRKTEETEDLLWRIIRENDLSDFFEINAYPAYISKLRGKYRNIILIKSKNPETPPNNILEKLPKEDIISANLKIDIDPISTS